MTVSAAPVTKKKAQSIAHDFLAQQGLSIARNSGPMKVRGKVNSSHEDQPEFFVFNADHQRGFVIVSGDDRTIPVLGYTTEGSFDSGNIPVQLQDMLDVYAEEIKALGKSRAVSNTADRPVYPTISPLLSTLWGQDYPYNKSCPVYDNKTCVTGCVPTATAMVMNYYQYPSATI